MRQRVCDLFSPWPCAPTPPSPLARPSRKRTRRVCSSVAVDLPPDGALGETRLSTPLPCDAVRASRQGSPRRGAQVFSALGQVSAERRLADARTRSSARRSDRPRRPRTRRAHG